MTTTRFLGITLPLVLILALLIFFLPVRAASVYVAVTQPLALLIGSALALYVSRLYRKQLRAAFVFLAAFLFIYMLAIVLFLSPFPILLSSLKSNMPEAQTLLVVESIQFLNYLMLVLFCVYLLKVVDIRRLSSNGWIVFAVTCVVSLFVAVYPEWNLFKNLFASELPLILYATIRLLDAALIIVLMPVIWLYIQYLKSRQKQSMTFTIVIAGIVAVTLLDYLFEVILSGFPRLLGQDSPIITSAPETIFVFGYLLIAVGLYAHRKQDEWGFQAIDKAMQPETNPVEIKSGKGH
ncbi:MAG: hypothetical protein HW402_55 [Dehalococcoidales bacterium]|nr:hypothetical protein [Dehalococcoidales bacterium]